MFIRIEKIAGKELEKPVSAYTYNRTGHYFCEGSCVSFNADLRLPENSESRDDNFDFVSWLKGEGVYLEVYDVSGAGDTVIAVLATLVAAGVPIPDAVATANRAGGIVVGKLGTASVTYEELFS